MRKAIPVFAIAIASAITLPPQDASAQLGGNLIVSVTSPAPGALVRATIPVNASVTIIGSLTVSSVQFKVDGVNVGAPDTTAPYSVPWNTTTASAGTHTLTAVARDLLGLQYTSNPVTVTVDNVPPAVTVNQAVGQQDPTKVSPINFTVVFSEAVTGFAAADVALSGTAGGNKSVAVTGGPTTFNVAVSGMTSGTVLATIAAGSAFDAAGNGNTASTSTDNTVTFDTDAPAVALTSPANGATVAGIVTIVATASDATGVAGVQFKIDGANYGGPDTAAPYEVTWDTTASSEGAHTLTAVAYDGVGNAGTAAAVAVTVANNATTRVEESSAAVVYTPANTWMLGYTGGYPWSGGTAALGFTAGQRATLSFTGTGVRWIGFRGPQTGIANVYLDGALAATVDAYAAAEATNAVLFTASGLAASPHTLAIEVTRTKNVASADYYVVVDAFDVIGASTGPDVTPPSVAISAPAPGSTVSGVVPITAAASDNVAVTGVRFFADGSPIGAEDTTAPYAVAWDTVTAGEGTHTLTAVARDGAGNTATSTGITVTVSNSSSVTAARFEETSQGIVFTPGSPDVGRPHLWWHGSRSRGWSNTTASFNRSAGARATFTFTGTQVSWIGFRAFWAGIANVYVDGAFVAEIDLFLPRCTAAEKAQGCDDERDNESVFSAAGLAPGSHTITIESTGRKHGSMNPICDPDPASGDPKNCAADYAVVVDAFDVSPGGSLPATGARSEETAASVTYLGTWIAGDTSSPWSGGSAARSSTAGSRAQFTFTGAAVRLVGYKGPDTGIARVFLDGSFHAEVDTFSPTRIQTVVFTATHLATGRHTVEIEVTGQKNANAADHGLFVDAFDVQSRFEDRDPSVVYAPAGGWVVENMDYAWSGTTGNTGGGTAVYSSTAGAQATFTFVGTGVTWIGFRSPLAGIAELWVDGVSAGRFDLYAAADQVRMPIYTVSGLTAGTHTLRIVVTGEKNPAASAAVVVVDAFDVVPSTPGPVVSRFQQSAATYPNGGWTTSSNSDLDSGRTVVTSTTQGSRVELTFNGTAVRWIGQRLRDTGTARVYLDGALVTTVDTSSAIQDEYQAVIFSGTGLASGSHTLAIEVIAGAGEPAGAPVRRVIVDAFEVY